jgi:hypothetical protein
MTTSALAPDTPTDVALVKGAAARSRPAWWQYIVCIVSNALFIALFLCGYLLAGINTVAVDGLAIHIMTTTLAAWSVAGLLLLASTRASVGKVLFGGAFFAMVATAFLFETKMMSRGNVIWSIFVLISVSITTAVVVSRLLGLSLHHASDEPGGSQRPWQFTLRSLIGGTVIAMGYAMVISNLLANGVLVKTLTAISPKPAMEGSFAIFAMGGIHIAVAAMAYALRSWKLTLGIGLLGFAMSLPVIIDPIMGGDDDIWRFHVSMIGTLLYSAAGIALPWTLIGVHTTWEKPVFER